MTTNSPRPQTLLNRMQVLNAFADQLLLAEHTAVQTALASNGQRLSPQDHALRTREIQQYAFAARQVHQARLDLIHELQRGSLNG